MQTPKIMLEAQALSDEIRSHDFSGCTTKEEIRATSAGHRRAANCFFAGVAKGFEGRDEIRRMLRSALGEAEHRGERTGWYL